MVQVDYHQEHGGLRRVLERAHRKDDRPEYHVVRHIGGVEAGNAASDKEHIERVFRFGRRKGLQNHQEGQGRESYRRQGENLR